MHVKMATDPDGALARRAKKLDFDARGVHVLFVTTTLSMTERHAALLGELAELGMAVARELQGRIAEAATPEAAERLALGFQRVARSVRMTLALEARLAREGEAGAREAAQRRAQAAAVGAVRRRMQVKAAVGREVWREYERPEAERWITALDAAIYEASLDEEAFMEGPVEAAIARIRAQMGLAANDAAPPAARRAAVKAGRRSSA